MIVADVEGAGEDGFDLVLVADKTEETVVVDFGLSAVENVGGLIGNDLGGLICV
jgi:hypothetical protein